MSKPERVLGLVEWEEVTGWARQNRLDDLVIGSAWRFRNRRARKRKLRVRSNPVSVIACSFPILEMIVLNTLNRRRGRQPDVRETALE